MRVSVVTDELSSDFETALELSKSMGIRHVEIRGIEAARFPFVTDYWRTRVPQMLRDFGMNVAALSPGLFKIPWPVEPESSTRVFRWEDTALFDRWRSEESLIDEHLSERLPRVIDAALELEVQTIVCFSFDRGSSPRSTGPAPDAVVAALRAAGDAVARHGLQLAIEVEHICWADTGASAGSLADRIDHPAVGINWDPANAYKAGEESPYPDGYGHVRSHVRHVHFKDALTTDAGRREFVVDGVLDWKGQLGALAEDRFDGFISVETHARPKVAQTRRTLERLQQLLG